MTKTQRGITLTKSDMTDKRIEFLKNKKTPNRRTRRMNEKYSVNHTYTVQPDAKLLTMGAYLNILKKKRKDKLTRRLKIKLARTMRKLNSK